MLITLHATGKGHQQGGTLATPEIVKPLRRDKPQVTLANAELSAKITRQQASQLLRHWRRSDAKLRVYKRTNGLAYLAVEPTHSATLITGD
jgi:hypothetical protein